MFDPVDPKQRLPDVEEGILQYWKEEDTFKRSVKHRAQGGGDILQNGKVKSEKVKSEQFSFYDGPPFATGLPHYGHILAGTIKDVIPRYQTMRGKHVERRFGWDCHGLPIENLIEQENDITNKQQIEEKGVGWFNDLCRGSVQRYTGEWREVVERMGRWVDMDWDYRTMDAEFMESMWWAFAKLHDKGLIYEGHKPMHICPRCVTPLSNFEVTQGYSDRTDMSVIMTFPLRDEADTYFLAWTTTPWSLPGNLWLLVGPDITYVKVLEKNENKKYIFAKNLVEKVMKDREYEVLEELKAKNLKGTKYIPLFDYFVDTPFTDSKGKEYIYGDRCFEVLVDEAGEVSDEDGTGIVHITNSHGEDGFNITQKLDIPVLHHLNLDGSFKPICTDFAGLLAKPEGKDPMATDKAVIAKLKDMGRHFDSYTFNHSYPHCWRCDSPLLNYATSSWFVKVEAVKKRMLDEKAKTEWMPAHIRDGRYGNWLENARDWAISRNRYWGTPLPIWRNEQGDVDVIGSRDDLMKKCQIRFTKITALRHGESEGNLIPIYQGQEPGTDLTKNGKAQAKATADWLKDETVDVIYCSPLARTRQTAEVIAKQLGAKVIVDDRLREVSFGEYEGKHVDFTDLSFLKARRAHKLESGTPESIYHFEGMETWGAVAIRIESFMKEILPKHRSEHVVIVTHADPLQNIRSYFTGEDPFKLSHQPYPTYAYPYTFFWDHKRQAEMDLHKDNVDDIVWSGSESEDSVDVTLVRHGETDWNKEKKIQGGGINLSLNETGRDQAKALAKHLKNQKFDVIVSSDRKRAAETAQILSDELTIPLDDPITEFNERMLGEWSGMNREEFIKERGANAGIHYETPKDGESLADFLDRIQVGVQKVLEKYAGKKILLVSHQASIQATRILIENSSYKDVKERMLFKNTESMPTKFNQQCKRIPEVLDCWFESGSMPYAQQHYPFELGDDKRKVPKNFPADFIAEGLDQTRAWFYTLMVLSVALFDETPFKNVVVNGIVLAEDGKKMSKRLKNYPDPMEVVHKHGADAVRFTLMSSPAVRAEDLRFSEKLVEETVRGVLLPLWNTYSFFVTYANAANFEPVETRTHSTHPLDMWIRAEVQDLVNRMTEQLDKYDLSATCAELHETIDALTNWYIRLSRRRFAGKGVMDEFVDAHGDAEAEDQHAALHTLYDVLLTLAQTLAPFCPYITEAIYLNLVAEDHASIHFTDWPETRKLKTEEQMLIDKTRLMRLVVSLGNSIRGEQKVKIRQPLAKAIIALPPELQKKIELSKDDLNLLRQELNVKTIEFAKNPEELAEAYVQVDARKVGPRLGGRVQEIIKAGKEGEFTIEADGSILILDETLAPDEATLVYRSKGDDAQGIAADRGVVVSIDTEITDELVQEGYARDIIRTVQRLRKENGYHFTDQIALQVDGMADVLEKFGDLIAQETRSSLQENSGEVFEVEIGEKVVKVQFEKKK